MRLSFLDTQSEFYSAERKVEFVPALISPQSDGRTGPKVDRRSDLNRTLDAVTADDVVGEDKGDEEEEYDGEEHEDEDESEEEDQEGH